MGGARVSYIKGHDLYASVMKSPKPSRFYYFLDIF